MASDQALRDLILASNPVGYWPLDNLANLGLDATGNGNNGTQSGAFSQTVKTLFGMDITMTQGGLYGLVVIPDRAEFRGNKISIEMVVAGVTDTNLVAFERGGNNRNWSVQSISSAQAPGQQGEISTFLGTPSVPNIFNGGATLLPPVAHIVMVLDGATLKTATNGAISVVSLPTGTGTQLDQGNIPLHLFSRGGSTGINFPIAHVAIYNRVLTDAEILARNELLLGAMPWFNAPLRPLPANQEPRSVFQPQDVVWRGGEGKGWAGPVPAVTVTADPLCQGQDLHWVRDGVQNVLQGYIESTVTIDGEGVSRRVLCFDQAGNLVGETMSRASDGKYRFDLLWLNRRYMLVAQDDPAFGPADYNAVAADYQLPTPYAPGQGVGLV
ncbi:TPA: hypothetical protein ACOA1Y_003483 [Vibrio cholerae]